MRMRPTLVATLTAFALIGCSDSHDLTAPSEAQHGDLELAASSGVVYTETNASEHNEVAVFHRAADGSLTAAGRFITGGSGTGGGLGNQGAVVLSESDDGCSRSMPEAMRSRYLPSDRTGSPSLTGCTRVATERRRPRRAGSR